MEYIQIGMIANTHGLKGELKIISFSDFDDLRYRKGNTVYIYSQGEYLPFVVETHREHKGFSLVSFGGYQDINAIEQYKGCAIFVNKDDREELPEGEYYIDELIGYTVEDESHSFLGEVINVEETNGAQNNLRIKMADGKEVLIPYVDAFVIEVNDKNKVITVEVIEGLL